MAVATTTIPSWVAPSLIANPDACTLSTCPISMGRVTYVPTLPGNALYAGIFGLLLISQILLGVHYRIWGFLGGMFGGLVLEVLGYAGRILLHSNPFSKPNFLLYLICLTIGPAFLSASIYLCLARIVVVYGEELSRFTPRFYTITFITFDFIALLLQAIGGAIASSATVSSTQQRGINIMVAGVAWQAASLGIFALLCGGFGWRVRRASESKRNPNFVLLQNTFRFKAFLWALALATLAIFVRSVYRCAELRQGFHGKLANQQITFMILEGPMIIGACTLLTIFHPGLSFQGRWHDAAWSLGKKEQKSCIQFVQKSSTESKWRSWMSRKNNNHLVDDKMVDIEDARR